MGAVQYSRSGCPDMDGRTSRFEPLSYVLGPLGRRNSFLGYRVIYGGLGALERRGPGLGRGIGSFSVVWAGVCRGPRPRPCSSTGPEACLWSRGSTSPAFPERWPRGRP
jgi:hypothetical protein